MPSNATPAQLVQRQYDSVNDNPRPSSTFFPQDENPPRPSTASGTESNYPSWLPRRPHKPIPRGSSHDNGQEIRSSNDTSSSNRPGPSSGRPRERTAWAHKYGRKPTARAVRILAVEPDHSDPAGLAQRSRSVAFRATSPSNRPSSSVEQSPINSAFDTTGPPKLSGARPRFRVPGLHLELALHPSTLNRVLFYLFPIFVFGHIPIQAFLDFNAVAMLLQ